MRRPQSEVVVREMPQSAGLVRLAYCLLGDRESAEDAVQEAYLSLYRNWDSLRDHGSSHAYLRAAVINRSRTDRAS